MIKKFKKFQNLFKIIKIMFRFLKKNNLNKIKNLIMISRNVIFILGKNLIKLFLRIIKRNKEIL